MSPHPRPVALPYVIQPFGLLWVFYFFSPFNPLVSGSHSSPFLLPLPPLGSAQGDHIHSGLSQTSPPLAVLSPTSIINLFHHTYKQSCPSFFISFSYFHSKGNPVVESKNGVAQDELDVGRQERSSRSTSARGEGLWPTAQRRKGNSKITSLLEVGTTPDFHSSNPAEVLVGYIK